MMKRVLIVCCLFSITNLLAQDTRERFGIKGGLNSTFFSVNENGLGSFTTSETGYFGGVFVEIPGDDFLIIQPETLYISVGDFDFINVPIYAKYEVVKRLYLLAGPSMNYFFDFFTNKFKVGADISSSYNITDVIDIHVKFALGFDELSPNGLFYGIGIKF